MSLLRPTRTLRLRPFHRAFSYTIPHPATVTPPFIRAITAAETSLTQNSDPIKNGPTAILQSHIGAQIDATVLRELTLAERKITGQDGPVEGGPVSVAQSWVSTEGQDAPAGTSGREQHSGTLNSATLSRITAAEKEITGNEGPVRGGPTAKAQSHANESITSRTLSDITDGEKKVTGGERVKGGPTSVAQSEVGKSRNQ